MSFCITLGESCGILRAYQRIWMIAAPIQGFRSGNFENLLLFVMPGQCKLGKGLGFKVCRHQDSITLVSLVDSLIICICWYGGGTVTSMVFSRKPPNIEVCTIFTS